MRAEGDNGEPGRLRVGTSGWTYDHWRGEFYPSDLPRRRWLEHYASILDTVEINATFYRLPGAETFARWRAQVPPGFRFAVKASRYLTHLRRLREPREPLERFFSRASALGSALGPVLYQLPPGFRPDTDRLETFLDLLPPGRLHVVEFRDDACFDNDLLDLMASHRVCLCLHDHAGVHVPETVTGPVAYLRFHGGRGANGNYGRRTLIAQAERIQAWLEAGTDVYAYFNNDVAGNAFRNAATLRRLIRVTGMA